MLIANEMRRTVKILAVGVLGATLWAQAPVAQSVSADTQQRIDALERKLADWGQLGYYRDANTKLPATASDERVVFYGASVVEFWKTRGAFGSTSWMMIGMLQWPRNRFRVPGSYRLSSASSMSMT